MGLIRFSLVQAGVACGRKISAARHRICSAWPFTACVSLTAGQKARSLQYAQLVGKSIGCNVILETQIWRYIDRVGGKYTAESPASVSFESRLYEIDRPAVIWTSKFDEVQATVLENIYDWKKANIRGFTWITAEELMREGLVEKLNNNPYLKKPAAQSDSTGYDERI